jgi:hypothetical protein
MVRVGEHLAAVLDRCATPDRPRLFARWRERRLATASAKQRARIAKARAMAVEKLMADQRAARSGFEAAYRRITARG